MKQFIKILFYIPLVFCIMACGKANSGTAVSNPADREQTVSAKAEFSADSAYEYIARQCAFGPRVPGSAASKKCADWMVEKLAELGADSVQVQQAQLKAYNGDTFTARNITAMINPAAEKRILLLSHWDSRPWADHDSDSSKRRTPIDGANDGASGVGVIMEIARALSKTPANIGVDILFVDAEDYGVHSEDDYTDTDETSWCLGTQYWVENPTLDLSKIRYAVLLDMVGGKNAVFNPEYFSKKSAPHVVNKVIKAAAAAGYSSRFPTTVGNPIVDDHIHLLKNGIPAIDIIETQNPQTGGFNPTWHTMADNIDNIDKETLEAVGQTLLNLIYSE